MCQIRRFRSESSFVSIPVDKAIYCRHCKTVSNSLPERCGNCGSEFVLHLATLVDQPPLVRIRVQQRQDASFRFAVSRWPERHKTGRN